MILIKGMVLLEWWIVQYCLPDLTYSLRWVVLLCQQQLCHPFSSVKDTEYLQVTALSCLDWREASVLIEIICCIFRQEFIAARMSRVSLFICSFPTPDSVPVTFSEHRWVLETFCFFFFFLQTSKTLLVHYVRRTCQTVGKPLGRIFSSGIPAEYDNGWSPAHRASSVNTFRLY